MNSVVDSSLHAHKNFYPELNFVGLKSAAGLTLVPLSRIDSLQVYAEGQGEKQGTITVFYCGFYSSLGWQEFHK